MTPPFLDFLDLKFNGHPKVGVKKIALQRTGEDILVFPRFRE